MSNSLQDQLLKSGLVSKDQAKKNKSEKQKQRKQQLKTKTEVVDETKEQVKQAQAEKAERDRELNRQKKEADDRKAIKAQIKQLIQLNRLDRGEGETAYNFTDGKKIKKIYVTDEIMNQLSKGRLSIAKLGDEYEVIPTAVAEKIKQRNENYIIVCNEQTNEVDEDDPYADYKIPDDLMW